MARKMQTPIKAPPESKPTKGDIGDIEERIERLERRIDESILGDDGVAAIDPDIDRSPSGDALQRAVRRSNLKRGSRKA